VQITPNLARSICPWSNDNREIGSGVATGPPTSRCAWELLSHVPIQREPALLDALTLAQFTDLVILQRAAEHLSLSTTQRRLHLVEQILGEQLDAHAL